MDGIREREDEMSQEYLPKWIAWETTRKCNLRCVHCRSASDMQSSAGGFSTAEAVGLIDTIADYYPAVLVLSGGEPLMRPDIFELARHGTDRGLRMCLATNGTLVDAAVCERIRSSGIRIVSMSLDGASAAVHDNFRDQPGAFEGVIRAARLFRASGIEFILNSSFTKRNQADIAATFRLAKSLGATAWYLFMIVPTGRGEDVLSELIPAADYEEILRWHYEQEKQESDMLMRPTCAPHYYRIIHEENRKSDDPLVRRNLKFSTGGAKGCLAGQTICLIDNNGDVYPCSYFPKSAGNVKTTPFREIWENSPLFAELRDFSRYKGRCGQCEYNRICGGCRARSFAITGDYLDEEPFCDYVPFRMRQAAAAAKGEETP
jgi:heme b synthase